MQQVNSVKLWAIFNLNPYNVFDPENIKTMLEVPYKLLQFIPFLYIFKAWIENQKLTRFWSRAAELWKLVNFDVWHFWLHRPEDIQQNNEHTPEASDAETEAHAGTLTIAQKPKKVKRRENQLAPRKLCFDAPGNDSI